MPQAPALLAALPPDGSTIGSKTLLRQLGWPEEIFWNLRDQLVQKNLVALGKGGSIRLLNLADLQSASMVDFEST